MSRILRRLLRRPARIGRSIYHKIQNRHEATKGVSYRSTYLRTSAAVNGRVNDYGVPDRWFETSDHRRIPVLPRYRRGVGGSLGYEPVQVLQFLESKHLLSESELKFLDHAVGLNTLNVPVTEIREFAKPLVARHSSLFFNDFQEVPGQLALPTPIPTDRQIQDSVASEYRHHKALLTRLSELGVIRPRWQGRLLEVGPDDARYSVIAFEKLGFETFGIDNAYGGLSYARPSAQYVRDRLHSSCRNIVGDITQNTGLEAESFDIVYSHTTLEHILNIPAAMREMHRLLRPDGLMIHIYNPWWAFNGGHTPGILDCPWGHVRMNLPDLLHYFDTIRPNEASDALPSFTRGLNRAYPIAEMQQLILRSRFDIRFWEEIPPRPNVLSDLTAEVAEDCFRVYPDIGMSDLIASNICFVARKRP